MRLYMNRCFANSHMSLPLGALTVRTSLYTYICSQLCIYIYINFISQIRSYMNPCDSSSHMFMPLRVLRPRSSGQDMPGPWVVTNLFHLTIYIHFFLICMYILYMHFIYLHMHILILLCICVCVLNLHWNILVLVVFFSKMFTLTLSILS